MSETRPIHPDMQVLLQARAPAPADQSIDEARAAWSAYSQKLARPCPGDMVVFDRMAPSPAREVPIRVYHPAGATAPGPAILYMHGGGFMKGDLDSSDSVAWGFAQETGASVVSVDYLLAPEHPYPAAFNDCYGVLCWLAEHGGEIDVDGARLAVAGDSAGGNLAAAISLAARDRQGPGILAQALIYPGTGLDQDHASYIENAEGPGLTTAGTRAYRDMYLPEIPDTDDAYARPVMAKTFTGLPPAHVHSAEIDPIRDDGRVYAAKLALAGGDVSYREAKGMIHGFMRARFTGPAAAAEYQAICDFLRTRLFL